VSGQEEALHLQTKHSHAPNAHSHLQDVCPPTDQTTFL